MPFADPEKNRECRRKYQSAHPEQSRKYSSKYRAAHLEEVHAAGKARRDANPEPARAAEKKYRKANREHLSEVQRQYRKDHPEYREKAKLYRDANREKIQGYQRAHRSKPDRRINLLVSGAKRRAHRSGLEFDESIRTALVANPPIKCCCCHAVFDYSMAKGVGMDNTPRSPSLDRVDNTKGYTVENTAVICYRCNAMKGAASIKDTENILAYMRAHQKPAP